MPSFGGFWPYCWGQPSVFLPWFGPRRNLSSFYLQWAFFFPPFGWVPPWHYGSTLSGAERTGGMTDGQALVENPLNRMDGGKILNSTGRSPRQFLPIWLCFVVCIWISGSAGPTADR